MPKSLQINTFGPPLEQIHLADRESGKSKDKNILVKIQASPINPADLNLIQGTYGVKPNLPFTLGVEGAGIIIESDLPHYPEGNQVIFLNRVGTWAEEVWVSPDEILPLQAQIDPLQAAMLKVNPMTAWRLLTGYTELSEGDYIIQNAANSGVGQCVIQLAKIIGIKTINLVRREELIAPLKTLGADLVLLDSPEVKDEILSLISEENLPKAAINAVGGDSALRLMDCLAEQGDHITYGAMSLRSLKVPNKFLIFKRICLHGLWVTKDIKELPSDYVNETYQNLASWIAEGKLTQPVNSTYPLSQFSEALQANQSPERNGKILFQPS